MRVGPLLIGTALAVSVGCTPRSRIPEPGVEPRSQAAIYRARATLEDGTTRRFKLFLWTDGEQRTHAEVLAPVGASVAILDGNTERLAVTFPRDREAFVGPSDPSTLQALIGLRVDVATWIDALLGRASVDAGRLDVQRTGGPGQYPRTLSLGDGEARLELELRRLRDLPGSAEGLGEATVPGGFTVRPLADLAGHPSPLEDMDPASD